MHQHSYMGVRFLRRKLPVAVCFLLLWISDAPGDGGTNALVCVGRNGPVTAEDLVGVSLANFTRLRTSGLAFESYEKLLQQTELSRKMGQYSGTNLASLTASIIADQAAHYDRLVRAEISLRLVEEFVLQRNPAQAWYYDPRKLRKGIESSSRLWAAKFQIWQDAATGLSLDEFKSRMANAFRTHPPVYSDEQQNVREIASEARRMVNARDQGRLEDAAADARMRHHRIRKPWDWEAHAKNSWIHAEVYNWWASYLLQRLHFRPRGDDLEQVFRNRLKRHLVVARVEAPQDAPVFDRILASVQDRQGGGLDWSEYRQALGFGEEFGLTNRHIVSYPITNGLLALLVGTNAAISKTEIRLLGGPLPGGSLGDLFRPVPLEPEAKGKQNWTPVELSDSGWTWLKERPGRLPSDPKHLRTWIGTERVTDYDGWISTAAEAIRGQTIAKLAAEDLRPAVASFLREFKLQNPKWFPDADQLMAWLIDPQWITQVCDREALGLLKDSVPR